MSYDKTNYQQNSAFTFTLCRHIELLMQILAKKNLHQTDFNQPDLKIVYELPLIADRLR